MGEKAGMIEAAKVIGRAIKGFVLDDESSNVHVFESTAGHLRVIVGSARFKDVGPVDRQNMIWGYLKDHVPSGELTYCFGVHPLDIEEYAQASFPQSAAESMTTFIEGGTTIGEDDD